MQNSIRPLQTIAKTTQKSFRPPQTIDKTVQKSCRPYNTYIYIYIYIIHIGRSYIKTMLTNLASQANISPENSGNFSKQLARQLEQTASNCCNCKQLLVSWELSCTFDNLQVSTTLSLSLPVSLSLSLYCLSLSLSLVLFGGGESMWRGGA